MNLRISLLASAVSLCVAAPVAAEPPIGSRLGERTQREPMKMERDAARGAQEMARCLVNKRKRTVQKFLAALTEEESERLSSNMSGEHQCFSMTEGNDLVEGRIVTFPDDIYRGMLAEWMIKSDWITFAALPALPRQLTYSRPWYAVSHRDVSIDEMATCISETAPAEILTLLDTAPYTSQEAAVFGGLNPYMGACLRAGLRLKGNRQSVRAALADALYQRVANPAPVPAPVTVPVTAPASTTKQPD